MVHYQRKSFTINYNQPNALIFSWKRVWFFFFVLIKLLSFLVLIRLMLSHLRWPIVANLNLNIEVNSNRIYTMTLHWNLKLKKKQSQFLLLFLFCFAFALLICTDLLISFWINLNFNLGVLNCAVITPIPNDLRFTYRKRKLKTWWQ